MNETKSASLQENKEAVFSTNQLHETTQTSAVNAVSNSVGAPMATTTNEANVKSSTPPPAKDTATVLLDKVSGKTHTHTIIYLLEHKVPTFYDIERYPTKERFLNCFLIHVLNTVVRPCTQEISSYTSHVIHFPNASLTLSLFLCFHCLYNGTILYTHTAFIHRMTVPLLLVLEVAANRNTRPSQALLNRHRRPTILVVFLEVLVLAKRRRRTPNRLMILIVV